MDSLLHNFMSWSDSCSSRGQLQIFPINNILRKLGFADVTKAFIVNVDEDFNGTHGGAICFVEDDTFICEFVDQQWPDYALIYTYRPQFLT